MIRKTLILAAAALAISTSMVAAPALAAPKQAPATQTQQMPKYEDLHKGAIGVLTKFKTMLSATQVALPLSMLPAELDKLPALEKAYVDAVNAGDTAAADKAKADYTAVAKKIVELALPLDQALLPVQTQIGMGFGQLGPTGEKLLKEADVKAITDDIEKTLAPLAKANEIIGPLHDKAAEAAQFRVQLEMKRIAEEEFANQVNNYLQGQVAK